MPSSVSKQITLPSKFPWNICKTTSRWVWVAGKLTNITEPLAFWILEYKTYSQKIQFRNLTTYLVRKKNLKLKKNVMRSDQIPGL